MSDSLQPHGLYHTRPLCFSLFPKVHVHWTSIDASVVPSSHLILWHPLLLPSIFPSIRDFPNELAVFIRWPKYWRFSIIPSNKYSGLISLKIDWFDLLAAQGTLRSLLQHHSLKASILQHPAFFIIQLSQVCDHWKDHSLDYTDLCRQSNVSALQHNVWVYHSFPVKKQMSSDFMAAVTIYSDFRAPRRGNLSLLPSFPPSICHAIMGPDAMILIFLMFSFKLALSLSSFTLIKRLFSSSHLSDIRVVSTYLRLLMFLPPLLIPACNSSSLAFLMMCSVYKSNKQGDNTLSYSFLNLEPVSCSI